VSSGFPKPIPACQRSYEEGIKELSLTPYPPELFLTASCCIVLSVNVKKAKGCHKNGGLMIQRILQVV